jgi:hypothetical protein
MCTTLLDTEHLTVVMSIPLLDNMGTFEVYRVHNLPLPYRSSNQHIQAQYELETNLLAINRQRSQFVIFTELEAKACWDPLRPLLYISKSFTLQNYGDACCSDIHGEKREGINTFCKETIIPRTPFPQARYLTD